MMKIKSYLSLKHKAKTVASNLQRDLNSQGIVIVPFGGNIKNFTTTFVNKEFEEIYGGNEQNLVGVHINTFMPSKLA